MKEKSKKKKQMKKAIVVARSATKEPTSVSSINSQLRWAKSKAKELDAAIYYIFSFCGMGANSFFEAYSEQILDVIRQQKIDYLFVYTPSRLTRTIAQGYEFLKTIQKLGCTIVTSTDIINAETVLHLPNINIDAETMSHMHIIKLAVSKYITKKCEEKHMIGRM